MKTHNRSLISAFVLVLVLLSTMAIAGDRRTNTYTSDGEWITLPDVGECNPAGCVLKESIIKTWDGHDIIHQEIDTDGDLICDAIMVFMPIVDPQFGVFYSLYQTLPCEE